MTSEPLKEIDWFKIITDKLCDEDINFSFPDQDSQEVTVINSAINERINSAVERFLEYHGAPISFLDVHPQYRGELDRLLEKNWRRMFEKQESGYHTVIHDFNEWLIKKAFEDITIK